MQIRIFIEELNRSFSRKRFLLIIGLSIVVFAIGYRAIEWIPRERSFVDLWYALYNQSYFSQLIPLLAALPFADSLITDKAQGYINQLLTRCNYRQVIRAKVAATALSGGFAVTIPLLILYGFTKVVLPPAQYPINHPVIDQYAVRPYGGILRALYMENPDGFILLVIAFVFLVGALYAMFGLSTSFITKNRFLAIGFPFLSFNIMQYFAERTRLFSWYWSPLPSLLTYPRGYLIETTSEIPFIFFNPLIILSTSLVIYLIFSQRAEVLENNGLVDRLQGYFRKAHFSIRFTPNISQKLRKRSTQNALIPGKPWCNYLRLQIRMSFNRTRWLLVLPAMIAISVVFAKSLSTTQATLPLITQPSQSANVPAIVNIWDVFFTAFGNVYSMAFVIANLFLVLISDLTPETSYEQLALLRLRSRLHAWHAKILTLFFLSGLYTLISAGTILCVAAFRFPGKMQWSLMAERFGDMIHLPALLPRQESVFTVLLIVLSLVTVGLFCLGLLSMLINSLTQKRLTGYLFVEALLLSSIGLATMLVNGPSWQMVIPIIRNLILPMVPFLGRGYPIWLSFVVWLLWLAILLPLGITLKRNQDFFAHPDL